MPAVAAVGAAWAAIGAYTVAGIAVGAIIQGAIVGAVVGGLYSAVTGGDIGKGILFGAIGGAVIGGVSAWAGAEAGGAAGGATDATTEGLWAVGNTTSESGLSATLGAETTSSAVSGLGAGASSSGGGGFLGGLFDGAGSALVTTAGTLLAGAFDDTDENTAEENQKNREAQLKLAQIEADTAVKVAGMRGSGGGGSNGDARYAADLQLKNAREQRAQDYKMKHEEYSLLDEARKRRAEAVSGAQVIAKPQGVLSGAQGVDAALGLDLTPKDPSAPAASNYSVDNPESAYV